MRRLRGKHIQQLTLTINGIYGESSSNNIIIITVHCMINGSNY